MFVLKQLEFKEDNADYASLPVKDHGSSTKYRYNQSSECPGVHGVVPRQADTYFYPDPTLQQQFYCLVYGPRHQSFGWARVNHRKYFVLSL